MRESAEDDLEGQVLGRYCLERLVGKGGMGRVYLATLAGSLGFEKKVAVKVLPPDVATRPRLVTMFIDEVRLASRIQHTNVCSVLDFGVQGDRLYLVMEYLDGLPLARVLRPTEQPIAVPPSIAARIVADAAQGLHAAHELRDEAGDLLNVVHRDVSPGNIFVLREGVVKVLDFGVARMKGRLTVTQADEVKGTLPYMAPERFHGEPLDRRGDLWSLGVILWEATVGRRHFRQGGFAELLPEVTRRPLPRPSELVEGYPPELEAIVMAALERDVERRTATAASLVEALERFIFGTGQPTGAMQVASFLAGIEVPSSGRHSVEEPAAPTGFGETASLGGPAEVEAAPDVSLLPLSGPPCVDSVLSTERFLSGEPLQEAAADDTTSNRLRILALGVLVVLLLVAGVWGVVSLVDGPVAATGGPAASSDRHPVRSAAADPPLPVTPPAAPGEDSSAGRNGTTVDADVAPATPDLDDSSPPRAPSSAPALRRPPVRPSPPRGSKVAVADEPAERTSAVAPPAEPGTLNLLVIPRADVRWRGRSLGTTPLFEHPLAAGLYTLELRPIGGGPSERITVRISPGQSTSRSVRLGAAPRIDPGDE